MDSPISLPPDLSFYDLQGNNLPDGPREWQPARMVINTEPERWQEVNLSVGGKAIPVRLENWNDEVCVLADWERRGTGHYGLRLTIADRLVDSIITIQPEKIKHESFTKLLSDLRDRLPAEVAIGFQRHGAMTGVRIVYPSETTFAEELLRLRRAVEGTECYPGLATVLPVIGRDPHKIFLTIEPWVRLDKARRPHPTRIAHVLTRSRNLNQQGVPEHVMDTRVEHTVDTYENRLLKMYVHQVAGRLRHLLLITKDCFNLACQVDALERRLSKALHQAAFLNDVSLPNHLPSRISMVLIKRAPYRAALEGYLEFRRTSVVQLDEPALDAPLENLPYLYQLWGTMEVLTELLDVSASFGYHMRSQRLVRHCADGFYVKVLPDGLPALELVHQGTGTEVILIPERSYFKSGGLISASYLQRPDISIQVRRPGLPPCVYLFDPKYKLYSQDLGVEESDGRPAKVDIDKMHAYRDAIRTQEGDRVVVYSATMYPGPSETYGDIGLTALHADPRESDLLRMDIRPILERALAINDAN
jgi:hypothetical protein